MADVSIEISLYPLSPNYTELIDEFILSFKALPNVSVNVNGISTQIFGEMLVIWPHLQIQIEKTHQQVQASFVIKVIKGTHPPDGIPNYLAFE
jgi:hypothetical protein